MKLLLCLVMFGIAYNCNAGFSEAVALKAKSHNSDTIAECGTTIKDDDFAESTDTKPIIFKSENYPKDYPKNKEINCKITIEIPKGKMVYAEFEDLDIYSKSKKCKKNGDYLKFTIGGILSFTYCGKKEKLPKNPFAFLPAEPTEKDFELEITFTSNKDKNNGKGFYLKIWSIQEKTSLGDFPCGVTSLFNVGPQNRIVDGQDTKISENPWQASIFAPGPSGSVEFICSGTLIHPSWVLTAFHCVDRYKSDPSQLQVYMNSDYVDHNFDGMYCPVTSVSVLPDESDFPFYDIALIQLQSPVDITSTKIIPACVPGASFDYGTVTDKMVTVTGWGSKKYYLDPLPTNSPLQALEMKLQSQDECGKAWGTPAMWDEAEEYVCCAKNDAFDGICSRDMGGPMIYEISDKYSIIGVASLTKSECGTGPSFFAKVTPALDWIQETVNPEE